MSEESLAERDHAVKDVIEQVFVTPQVTTQNTLSNVSKITENRPDIEVALLAYSDIISNASTTNMIIAEQIAEKRENWISNVGYTALRKIVGSKKSLGVETNIPEIAVSKIFESDQYLKKLALCLNIGTMFAETSVEETISLFNQEIHKAKPCDMDLSENLNIEQPNTYDQTTTTKLQTLNATSKSKLGLETLHMAPQVTEKESLDGYTPFQSERYNSMKPDKSFTPHTAISSQLITSSDQIQNLTKDRFNKEKPIRNIEINTSVNILYDIFSGNAKVLQPFVFNTEKADCRHRMLRPMNIHETVSSDCFNKYTTNLPIEKINKSITESNLSVNVGKSEIISEVPSHFKSKIPALNPLIGAEANNLATATISTNQKMESANKLQIAEIESESIKPKPNPNYVFAYFNNIEIILENLRSIEKFEKMKELYTSTRKHMASKFALNVFDSQNLVEDTHSLNQSKPNREKLNILSEPFNLSTSIHKQQMLMDNVNYIEPKTGHKQKPMVGSENRLFNIGSKHMQTALEHPQSVPSESTKSITAKTSKVPMRNTSCINSLQQPLEGVLGVQSDNMTLLKPNINQAPSELVISSVQKQLQLENTNNVKKAEQNNIKLNPFIEDKNNLVVGQQASDVAFENSACFQKNQNTEISSISTESSYLPTNQKSNQQIFENVSQLTVTKQSSDVPDITTIVYGMQTNSKQEVLTMDCYIDKKDTEDFTREGEALTGKSIHHPLSTGIQKSQEAIETLQKTKLSVPSFEAPTITQETSEMKVISNESVTKYENASSLPKSLLNADKGKTSTETPMLLLGMKYSILPVESSNDLNVENYNPELSKVGHESSYLSAGCKSVHQKLEFEDTFNDQDITTSKPTMSLAKSNLALSDKTVEIPMDSTMPISKNQDKAENLQMSFIENRNNTMNVVANNANEKVQKFSQTFINKENSDILVADGNFTADVKDSPVYENIIKTVIKDDNVDHHKAKLTTNTTKVGVSTTEITQENVLNVSKEDRNLNKPTMSITDSNPVATNTNQTQLEHVKVVRNDQRNKSENAKIDQEKGLFIGNISGQMLLENTENLGEKQNSTVKVTGISQESYASGTLSQQVSLDNISNIHTSTNNLEKSKHTYQIGNFSAGVNMQQTSLDSTTDRSEDSIESHIPSVTNESQFYHLGVNKSQTKLDSTTYLQPESLSQITPEVGDVTSLNVAETNQPQTRESADNFLNFTFNKKVQASRNIKSCHNYSLDINMPLESLEHDKIAQLQNQGANINLEPETFVIGLHSQNTTGDTLKNLESHDNNIYEYASVTLTAPERKKHGKIVVNQFMNKSLEEEIDDEDITISADKSIDENMTKNASISFQLQHGMDVDFTVFLGDTDETEQTGEQNAVETTFKLHPRQTEPQPVEHQPDVYSSYKQTISTNDFNLKLKKPCKPTDIVRQGCTFNNKLFQSLITISF